MINRTVTCIESSAKNSRGARKTLFKYWSVATCLLITGGCAQSLSPFTSDGCSSFPDGTLTQATLWLNCCTAHDQAYWRGGTFKERHMADQELHSCVAKTGQPEIAKLMLAGVRVGGTPYLPTSFRWGYGWQYPSGYKDLSEDELLQIKRLTK